MFLYFGRYSSEPVAWRANVELGTERNYISDNAISKINLVYQNHNRPMGGEVVRILRSIAGARPLPAGVLILGDIASDYCVCRAKGGKWPDLRMVECEAFGGVDFYFEPWSGEIPRAPPHPTPHAANADWMDCSYGWGLLDGGLDPYGIDGGEIESISADLCAHCFFHCADNLIRK